MEQLLSLNYQDYISKTNRQFSDSVVGPIKKKIPTIKTVVSLIISLDYDSYNITPMLYLIVYLHMNVSMLDNHLQPRILKQRVN